MKSHSVPDVAAGIVCDRQQPQAAGILAIEHINTADPLWVELPEMAPSSFWIGCGADVGARFVVQPDEEALVGAADIGEQQLRRPGRQVREGHLEIAIERVHDAEPDVEVADRAGARRHRTSRLWLSRRPEGSPGTRVRERRRGVAADGDETTAATPGSKPMNSSSVALSEIFAPASALSSKTRNARRPARGMSPPSTKKLLLSVSPAATARRP